MLNPGSKLKEKLRRWRMKYKSYKRAKESCHDWSHGRTTELPSWGTNKALEVDSKPS
jgi:hypothetical protein